MRASVCAFLRNLSICVIAYFGNSIGGACLMWLRLMYNKGSFLVRMSGLKGVAVV